ncbi:transposase [Rhizobium laguerreae]|nr:transposase [Rhizobium laguerreae]
MVPIGERTPVSLAVANDVSWARSKLAGHPGSAAVSIPAMTVARRISRIIPAAIATDPKCQGIAHRGWVAARICDLLPVPYFHVVFTLPPGIAEITFHNKAIVYALLMRIAAQTLQTVAADPKRFGAEIGIIAVLHTWGQAMTHHPHVHCVVPSGGLSPAKSKWLACRPGFFLPVRVLSRVFQRLFLTALADAFAQGELRFSNAHAHLADPAAFTCHLGHARAPKWVVYAKPPYGGRTRCSPISADTHTAWLSPTVVSSVPMTSTSIFDGKIIDARAMIERRSCAFTERADAGEASRAEMKCQHRPWREH